MTTLQVLVLIAACSLSLVGAALFFAYQRWYLPRLARLKVERLRREEAAGTPPSPRDYHFAITFDSGGINVTSLRDRNCEPLGMRWADVCRAICFKRDLGVVDCICLFFARVDGMGVELNEEMAGWNRLVEALPQHLPGCKSPPEWFSAVAFPAFATNETEIYCRVDPRGDK